MSKDLESRLAELERQLAEKSADNDNLSTGTIPKQVRRRRAVPILWATFLTLLIIAGSATWFFMYGPGNRPNELVTRLTPIEAKVQHTLYYPSSLGEAYIIDPKSIIAEAGSVTYRIRNGQDVIVVNQQPAPRETLKFESLPGFRPLTVPAGQAYTGIAASKPVLILMTQKTLISIGADKATPTSAERLADIARSLVPITE